jgi:hypothetical protein
MRRFLPTRQATVTSQASFSNDPRSILITIVLAVFNQDANVGATTVFAASGISGTICRFLTWQIIRSTFGLGTQLNFAGLVRFTSV